MYIHVYICTYFLESPNLLPRGRLQRRTLIRFGISRSASTVCMYVHTCYVLIKTAHTIYYVLAAVFASWFCVLISLFHEWGHIYYYVLAAVKTSWFYVLISLLHEWGHINYYVLAVVIASYISSCSKFGSWVRPLTIIFTSTNLVLSSYIFCTWQLSYLYIASTITAIKRLWF